MAGAAAEAKTQIAKHCQHILLISLDLPSTRITIMADRNAEMVLGDERTH